VDEAEVISELYGLPPGDFTRVRNERAAQARIAGDKALAARLKALRKPTASAWALNMLVRRHPEEINDLLELGGRLREAQTSLAGDQLRELTKQRRQAVAALGRQARALAAQLGQRLSPAAGIELEDSLNAALADPSAGYAVRSGRMTAPISYVGLGPLAMPADVEESVAPAPGGLESVTTDWPAEWPDEAGGLIWSVPDRIEPVPAARTGRVVRPAAVPPPPSPSLEEARLREELEQARRRRELDQARFERDAAERAAADAAVALRDAQIEVDQVTERRKALDRRVDELNEELRKAEEEAMRAAKDVLAARHDRDSAARADLIARRAAERARAEVERLDHP
jgi:hypothetical protein